MRKCFALAVSLSVMMFALAGCSDKSEAPKPMGSQAPAASAMPPAAGMPPSVGVPDRGMVTEALEGDGNTYIKINAGGNSYWYAAPRTAVNVGEVVLLKNPTLKTGYSSAELKKDFGDVYFITGVSPMNAGQAHQRAPGTTVEVKDVKKLSGGHTVAELFQQKDALANKEVSLRAKVVKYSGGIMGTNWMHLRDGTGDDKTNDLTITSQAMAKPGDTVTVRGVLQKDVDIGSGYFFPLIIRDAKVTVE